MTLTRLAAALLFLAAPAAAAPDHAHHGGLADLRTDQGRKWPTDKPLRGGMANIRAMVAAAPLDANLGDRIEAEVEAIARDCKLAPEADAQLHLILAELLDGAARLKKGEPGAESIKAALEAYGAHFDHPDWHPPRH